jgi:predicted nucleic acid-binding protein
MIAYDTDVLVELLKGHPAYAAKARAIPGDEQFVPIVVVEEIQRGRLNSIRQAEAGKGPVSLERAYELYEQTFVALRSMPLLSYTRIADSQFQAWRQLKVRGSTHDLRIAAICIAHSADASPAIAATSNNSPDSVWRFGSDPPVQRRPARYIADRRAFVPS